MWGTLSTDNETLITVLRLSQLSLMKAAGTDVVTKYISVCVLICVSLNVSVIRWFCIDAFVRLRDTKP